MVERINLSNLKQEKGEFDLPGNSTSVRGEYFIPQINKTGFFKQNGCMIGETRGKEDFLELFASRIMDIIGFPHAEILLAKDDNFGNGCLSINILRENEHFVEPDMTQDFYDSHRDIDGFIERDLNAISSISEITSQDLRYRKEYLLKYLFVSALISNTDIKMDNMFIIKNETTGRFRNPEYYDMGIAFSKKDGSQSDRMFFGKLTPNQVLQQLYENYPSQIVPFGKQIQKTLTKEKILGLVNGEFYNELSYELKQSIVSQLSDIMALVISLNGKYAKKIRYGTNNLHDASKGVKISLIDKVKNYLSKIKERLIGDEERDE